MNISSLKYHSVAKQMLWVQLDEVFNCTASTQWLWTSSSSGPHVQKVCQVSALLSWSKLLSAEIHANADSVTPSLVSAAQSRGNCHKVRAVRTDPHRLGQCRLPTPPLSKIKHEWLDF